MNNRTILTPKNTMTYFVNDILARCMSDKEHVFGSANTIAIQDDQVIAYRAEFLNTLILIDMLIHKLILKVGVLVILMHNLDPTIGLCNGTRMIVFYLAGHVITTEIIGGSHARQLVHIPRITIIFTRHQGPFIL